MRTCFIGIFSKISSEIRSNLPEMCLWKVLIESVQIYTPYVIIFYTWEGMWHMGLDPDNLNWKPSSATYKLCCLWNAIILSWPQFFLSCASWSCWQRLNDRGWHTVRVLWTLAIIIVIIMLTCLASSCLIKIPNAYNTIYSLIHKWEIRVGMYATT